MGSRGMGRTLEHRTGWSRGKVGWHRTSWHGGRIGRTGCGEMRWWNLAGLGRMRWNALRRGWIGRARADRHAQQSTRVEVTGVPVVWQTRYSVPQQGRTHQRPASLPVHGRDLSCTAASTLSAASSITASSAAAQSAATLLHHARERLRRQRDALRPKGGKVRVHHACDLHAGGARAPDQQRRARAVCGVGGAE